MPNVQQYTHLAEVCEKNARDDPTLEYRLGWTVLAQSYRTLAEQTGEADRRAEAAASNKPEEKH
ncbi:MAG TPA: hypothetical protein VFX37_05490 [Pseudolabrys sp.]|nr:hypothetical protein [Pseudolabrys sp.]